MRNGIIATGSLVALAACSPGGGRVDLPTPSYVAFGGETSLLSSTLATVYQPPTLLPGSEVMSVAFRDFKDCESGEAVRVTMAVNYRSSALERPKRDLRLYYGQPVARDFENRVAMGEVASISDAEAIAKEVRFIPMKGGRFVGDRVDCEALP